MRIVDTIPHPVFRISIFQMNNQYQVKLEGGPMEQVYKLKVEDYPTVEEVKQVFDETFLAEAHEQHNRMFLMLKAARERQG